MNAGFLRHIAGQDPISSTQPSQPVIITMLVIEEHWHTERWGDGGGSREGAWRRGVRKDGVF